MSHVHHHGHCHECEEHGHHHEHGQHEHGHHGHEDGGRENRTKSIAKIIISVILLIAAIITGRFELKAISIALFVLAYLVSGFEVLKEAGEGIIHGEIFGEEFLMALASIGAFVIGEYAEASAVMILFNIGEFLEDLAVDKSRDSITALMDIRPDYANLITEHGEQKVDPDMVKIGNIITVKPGERIPLDGTVQSGSSALDASALTGEAVPLNVSKGSNVLSGCINMSGLINIEVTKTFDESTASRILELAENAGERKSKSENFIDRFARVYTPAVCILALLLAFVPPVFLGQPLTEWVHRALTFLVISCPCALVISVPLSFFAGIGAASRESILIKGSNYLEALSRTKTVVLDKTGTLTEGVFEVTQVNPADIVTRDELLQKAAYAEANSLHPIAMSIIRAYGKEIDAARVSEVCETAGKGVKAISDGRTILAGNEKLMDEAGVDYAKVETAGTVIYVAEDGSYIGNIVISDKIKEDSKEAIEGIRTLGVKRTVMLTGDDAGVAEIVAKVIGADEVYAELLPDGKLRKLEKIIEENDGTVVFAGDGVNDAPVLARADVGIAMGGIGSDAAIEAADIVIMDDKPSGIGKAIRLSKRTVKISTENIIFAIAVKIVVLLLGALGLASMWAAVFADVGVCLLCVLNSLRNMKKLKG